MEAYLPMTIIPGIGLIILSTSNIILELNREISELEKSQHEKTEIIKLKLFQLKVLNISIVFQYLGVLLFLLSGIATSIYTNLPKELLFIGVGMISISIILLLFYSIKSVSIRQKHLNLDKGTNTKKTWIKI